MAPPAIDVRFSQVEPFVRARQISYVMAPMAFAQALYSDGARSTAQVPFKRTLAATFPPPLSEQAGPCGHPINASKIAILKKALIKPPELPFSNRQQDCSTPVPVDDWASEKHKPTNTGTMVGRERPENEEAETAWNLICGVQRRNLGLIDMGCGEISASDTSALEIKLEEVSTESRINTRRRTSRLKEVEDQGLRDFDNEGK
ncbi:hypothetical protein DFH09DRAFT_1088828 [Mycena vulgaris]|nr:hypothetical protein DFH09DRAFT_1088828 [Mycena vulgaris]